MKIVNRLKSSDTITTKFVQETSDGMRLETTYVNYHNKHIICFATQIGCNYGCKFCTNGLAHNFRRNLEAGEIFAQCQNVVDAINIEPRHSKEKPILFSAMGCGDPLANPRGVEGAFKILHYLYPNAKFAMATTGVPIQNFQPLMNAIDNMNHGAGLDFKLTISLHSAIEEKRKMLLPSSGNLNELMDALEIYQKSKKTHRVEYNVVLFDEINDSEEDAIAIADLLKSRGLLEISKVKLNQYNYVAGSDLSISGGRFEFEMTLDSLGVDNEYYITDGSDVGAACGQLTAYQK